MPEQKPYPVEKQACHYDEKQVCEQKEITEPKQVKKYVYKKECKKVPREICSKAVYKSLEVNKCDYKALSTWPERTLRSQ